MIETIISKIKEFPSEALKNREKYIIAPEKNFTRKAVLNFYVVTLCINFLLKKSLAVEFEDLFYKLGFDSPIKFHKSSFSRARVKVNPIFFKDWAEKIWTLFRTIYKDKLKTWNGFFLVGVDGSKVYLFNNDLLKEKFGTQTNQFGEKVMAHIVVAYDVLNDFIIKGNMGSYQVGETTMVMEWLKEMDRLSLMLYDRLFPSAAFIYVHGVLQINFLMRFKVGFNQVVKDFVASGQLEAIVSFELTTKSRATLKEWGFFPTAEEKSVQVRLIRVVLDNGEIEILGTSLLDKNLYPAHEFKWLYSKRWGSETAYDRLKNKFKMEIFSGRTPQSVLQDCFATWFLYNLQSVFIRSLDEEVQLLNQQAARKRKVQINRNATLGILKIYFADLFFKESNKHLITLLQAKFMKHLTDDIKGTGQQRPRKKKAKRVLGKHQTYTNYAPAI